MDHFALDGLPPTSAVETIPCAVTFVSTAVANHEAALVLRIKPGGELLGARLNFILWRMDQGELVLASAGGQSWRFQEEDTDLNLETRARRRRQVIGLALRS
ncbi:hypothetical protein GWE18_12505 [Bradyrhizobium sp. CSA112]|uniref:hypothetical protein n=1 Tax=Bradyrhizobium sp. CSA112 TaxID=2699170 RepID=UPI0023B159E0|nr:hypothetical protein [Bradyrhizobium sp. CSA112]MDE5453669.1 hypothetical protein [Bradyrhizobium sp. CSA112]